MVAPKSASVHAKEKFDEKKSPSSPEPFHEPDGMMTIDLNKSDDYSKENDEVEKEKFKQRAQIKYTTHLLFALCSLFFVVLVMIIAAFLNKEYHLFTILPLKVNHSHPNLTTPSPTEEFVNLTKILNQALFRDKLKSGGYLENAYGEMELCRLKQTLENCCEIFKDTDLEDLAEYCTVNEMLNLLLELEEHRRKKRQVYDEYPNEQYPIEYNDQAPPMPDDQFIPQQHFEIADPNDPRMMPQEVAINNPNFPHFEQPLEQQFMAERHFEMPDPLIPPFEQQPLIENPLPEREQMLQRVTEDFHRNVGWAGMQQDRFQLEELDEFARSGGIESKLHNIPVNINGNLRFPEEPPSNNQDNAKQLQNHDVGQDFPLPVFRPDLGLIEESLAGFHPRESEINRNVNSGKQSAGNFRFPEEHPSDNQDAAKKLPNHNVAQDFPLPVFRPNLGLIEESLAGFHPRESEVNRNQPVSSNFQQVIPGQHVPPTEANQNRGFSSNFQSNAHQTERIKPAKTEVDVSRKAEAPIQPSADVFKQTTSNPAVANAEQESSGGLENTQKQVENSNMPDALLSNFESNSTSNSLNTPPNLKPSKDKNLSGVVLSELKNNNSEVDFENSGKRRTSAGNFRFPEERPSGNQDAAKKLPNHNVAQNFPLPIFRPDLGLIEESLAGFHPRESEVNRKQPASSNFDGNARVISEGHVPPTEVDQNRGFPPKFQSNLHQTERIKPTKTEVDVSKNAETPIQSSADVFKQTSSNPAVASAEQESSDILENTQKHNPQLSNFMSNSTMINTSNSLNASSKLKSSKDKDDLRPSSGVVPELKNNNSQVVFENSGKQRTSAGNFRFPEERPSDNQDASKKLPNHNVAQDFPLPIFRPDLGLIEESLAGFHPRESEVNRKQPDSSNFDENARVISEGHVPPTEADQNRGFPPKFQSNPHQTERIKPTKTEVDVSKNAETPIQSSADVFKQASTNFAVANAEHKSSSVLENTQKQVENSNMRDPLLSNFESNSTNNSYNTPSNLTPSKDKNDLRPPSGVVPELTNNNSEVAFENSGKQRTSAGNFRFPEKRPSDNQDASKKLPNHNVAQDFPLPVFTPDLGLIEESLAGFHPRESEVNRKQPASSNFDENARVISEGHVSPTEADQNRGFPPNFQSNPHQTERIKPTKTEVDVSKNAETPIQSSADVFKQTSSNPAVASAEQESSDILENTQKHNPQLSNFMSNSTMINTSNSLNASSKLKSSKDKDDLRPSSGVVPELKNNNSQVVFENSGKQRTSAGNFRFPEERPSDNQDASKKLPNHNVAQDFPLPVFTPDLGLIEESLAGFHPRESEVNRKQPASSNFDENARVISEGHVSPTEADQNRGFPPNFQSNPHQTERIKPTKTEVDVSKNAETPIQSSADVFKQTSSNPAVASAEQESSDILENTQKHNPQLSNFMSNSTMINTSNSLNASSKLKSSKDKDDLRPSSGVVPELKNNNSQVVFENSGKQRTSAGNFRFPEERPSDNQDASKKLPNHNVAQDFPLPVFTPDLGLIEESLAGFHPRESEVNRKQPASSNFDENARVISEGHVSPTEADQNRGFPPNFQSNPHQTERIKPTKTEVDVSKNAETPIQSSADVFKQTSSNPAVASAEQESSDILENTQKHNPQLSNFMSNSTMINTSNSLNASSKLKSSKDKDDLRPSSGVVPELKNNNSQVVFENSGKQRTSAGNFRFPEERPSDNQDASKKLPNHNVAQDFPLPIFRPDLGLIEESLAGFHPRESEVNKKQPASSNFEENARVISEGHVPPAEADQNRGFPPNFENIEHNAHHTQLMKPIKTEVNASKKTETPIQRPVDIFNKTSTNPAVPNAEPEFLDVLENTSANLKLSEDKDHLGPSTGVVPELRNDDSDFKNSGKQRTSAQNEDAHVDEALKNPLRSKLGNKSGLEVNQAANAFDINSTTENIRSNSGIQHSKTFNATSEDIHEEASTTTSHAPDKENLETEMPSTPQESLTLKPTEDKIQQTSNSQSKQTGRNGEIQDFDAPNPEKFENKDDLKTTTSEADPTTNSGPKNLNLHSKFINEDAIANNNLSITTTVMPEITSPHLNKTEPSKYDKAQDSSTLQDPLLQFQQPTSFQVNEDVVSLKHTEDDHGILGNARANADQNDFRGKAKQLDSFTATEDVQSNQQAMLNPCFYPYMNPYMQFLPPPPKVSNPQDSGYLKIISVSQPKIQNQPMYVLNPSMYYGIPPSPQPTYPSNPYLPPTYYPPPPMTQAPQNSVGASHNAAIQVAAPGGQYYMCNPIPTPTNNIAGLAGVEVRREASNLQTLMEGIEYLQLNNRSREATLICPLGEQACEDGSLCIKNHHICDSEVHCDDSSDEIACSCKERVGKLRLCDGYCDCPRCDDEQGCFGCEPNEFSCDDWSRFRRSTCIPLVQKCDGIKQCEVTGKDEMDCSILADHIGNFPLSKVSNSVGFLHRNYRGKWYPTCFGTELWAAQVCQVEAGPSAIIPKAHMTLTTDPYNGLFINILPDNEVSLVNTCVQDRAAFVECPPIYCGLRFLVNNPYRDQEVDTSIEDMLNDLERAYKMRESDLEKRHVKGNLTQEHLEEVIENLERTFTRRDVSSDDSFILKESRVVGGKPSQPAAWPWLISIYKNGIFHCGGVLINELWVVTASHCVDRYWQYYYEIQAGALRRYSYAPMDQRRWAKVVIPHEFYSKNNLRNDIALMKLSAPVRYNRHVRPICLPSESTAGQEFLKGPGVGTICTTVGWGATVEHGADPDHMREVEVPILEHCKHREDSDIEEICAGLHEGGKDACQGDSGGPLMCRNPNNPNQWYLAGIVSHGEGCARPNEPGVYTKVSRYIGWIAENTREDKLTLSSPLQKCPGYICRGTKRCIAKKRRCDRIIDCLLGDDELDCENQFKQVFKHSNFRKSMIPTIKPSSDFMANLVQSLGQFSLLGSSLNSTKEDVSEDDSAEEAAVENDFEDDMDSSRASEKKGFEDVYFKCQILLQVIPIEKRCNKIKDCEDGTDELNCSCADYIRTTDGSAICDGVTDCVDLSDENDCVKCNKTEYTCRLSQKCIDITKRCDGTSDCPQNEDELNCVSLTNGHTIALDKDNRPTFKSRGIVSVNHEGAWKPLCMNDSSPFANDESSLSTVICNLLGFDEYLTYHKYRMEDRMINSSHSISSGRISLDPELKKCDNCCNGLYISCSNTSTSSTLHYKSLEQVKELYFSPWMAAIYANGEYKCMGTLLDEFWIVTSAKCFKGIQSLHRNYVVAVLGKGKLHLTVKGPHEQVIRVSGSVVINETDIILLRLINDVKFNRYVQAADLNARRDGLQKEKCYAVGKNNENRTMFVPLMPLKNCLVGYRCFEKKIEENCNDNHAWSGTIICDSRLGWYPAAVFNEDDGHCGLSHNKKYTSVKFFKNQIFKIMTLTPKPMEAPLCLGLQCNLGNCIPETKICDGVNDCHDGEDENAGLCYEKEKDCNLRDNCVCPPTHLKCPSTNKCHPKSTFCDRTNDCGEFQDEPDVCSCRNYLKLTDPRKLCDGILNCMDRTDEDPEMCDCKLDDFQCGKLNKCVPQEMVCDGVQDCPNGEDEADCLSLKTEDNERINAGEVMTKTAGVWHSGCFDLTYSATKLAEICSQLGLNGSSASQLTPPQNLTTLSTLRPVLDKFDVVWLRRQPGNKMRLRLRSGHDPYVKFVKDKKCHRLFVACI